MGGKPHPKAEHTIELVQGKFGHLGVYLDDYRIAGEKPWGGGEVIKSWQTRGKDIRGALAGAGDEESKTVDHKALLKKYINHVRACARATYIGKTWDETFTEEEWAMLHELKDA